MLIKWVMNVCIVASLMGSRIIIAAAESKHSNSGEDIQFATSHGYYSGKDFGSMSQVGSMPLVSNMEQPAVGLHKKKNPKMKQRFRDFIAGSGEGIINKFIGIYEGVLTGEAVGSAFKASQQKEAGGRAAYENQFNTAQEAMIARIESNMVANPKKSNVKKNQFRAFSKAYLAEQKPVKPKAPAGQLSQERERPQLVGAEQQQAQEDQTWLGWARRVRDAAIQEVKSLPADIMNLQAPFGG